MLFPSVFYILDDKMFILIPRLTMLLSILAHTAKAVRSAFTTRGWNCCKSSCSWPGVANVTKPVTACNGRNLRLKDYGRSSSCEIGGAYACADQHPWQIDDTTSYGFAAAEFVGEDITAWCCACYKLTFISGLLQSRTMVVQAVSRTTLKESSDTFALMVCIRFIGSSDWASAEPLPR